MTIPRDLQRQLEQEDLARYARDPVAFIDRFIQRNELGQPFVLMPHQREVLRCMFQFDQVGRLPYDTLVYSARKKSGKTTINGATTTWWGFTQEAPNELKLVANDAEQSMACTFKTIEGLLRHNPELGASADVRAKSITLTNGSVIQALANDYAGEAGANQGWTSWTELWAFVSESGRRLWEELTPVPTRRNSVRFIDTYAGFLNESELLLSVYKTAVEQGERIHPTLPIFANREARICAYWDDEARMPWQTPEYYAAQRKTLRPNAYRRLHENAWVTGTEQFITEELWDACVDDTATRLLPTKRARLWVGVDASTKHDSTAVVAVTREGDRFRLALHRIWRPSPESPLDLEATVEAFLRELCALYQVQEIRCDPFQMHRSIMTLQKARLPIAEFPQTVANTTRMGQVLFDALTGRNLLIYPSEELRAQALNTVALESARGWRVAKEKTSKKIDAIVALAMACCSAIDAPDRNKEVLAAIVPTNPVPAAVALGWGGNSQAMQNLKLAKSVQRAREIAQLREQQNAWRAERGLPPLA